MSACALSLVAVVVISALFVLFPGILRSVFYCIARRSTLQPCDTPFHVRLKGKIVGRLLGHKRVARFVYRHFDTISFVMILLFFIYMANLAYGLLQCFF